MYALLLLLLFITTAATAQSIEGPNIQEAPSIFELLRANEIRCVEQPYTNLQAADTTGTLTQCLDTRNGSISIKLKYDVCYMVSVTGSNKVSRHIRQSLVSISSPSKARAEAQRAQFIDDGADGVILETTECEVNVTAIITAEPPLISVENLPPLEEPPTI